MSKHNRERRLKRAAENPDYRKPDRPTIRPDMPSGIVYRTHVSTATPEQMVTKPALRPARELRVQSGRYLNHVLQSQCGS